MAKITFYEKPGCINNTKQKELLRLAGHLVNEKDLIAHPWTEMELLNFFGTLEVKNWFNPNAPDVYNGVVKPESYTREKAVDALLGNHLLIKRPLMIIDSEFIVGFDKAYLDAVIGLKQHNSPRLNNLLEENLSDCPQKADNLVCD